MRPRLPALTLTGTWRYSCWQQHPYCTLLAMTTRARTILTNTGFNVVGMAVTSVIALALTPLLLRGLGSEMFGVWALFGVVVAVSQMLDFGLGRALVRRVAQGRSLGQWSTIAAHLNSDFWPLVGLVGLLAASVWLAAPWLAGWLGVPAELSAVGAGALRLMALSFLPILCTLIFTATLEGAQRMAYTSLATILNRLTFAAVALLAVGKGMGLLGVAVAFLAASLLQTLVVFVASRRVQPGLRTSPRLARQRLLAQDWRFGRFIFATSLIALAFTATNKIALARWSGLTSVAYYELAAVVAGQLFILALAITQALYPAFAAAHSEGGLEAVRHLFTRALRLTSLVVVPLGAAIIALAGPFISAWFGEPLAQPVMGLRWLTLAWTIVSLAASASVALQATGRPALAWLLAVYNMLVNLALVLLLVPRWGFSGIIAANSLAVSSSGVLTLWVFGRVSNLKSMAIVAALSPAVIAWILALALGLAWLGARLHQPTLYQLAVLGSLYGLCYAAGLMTLGLLRPEESAWLRQHLRLRSSLQGIAP